MLLTFKVAKLKHWKLEMAEPNFLLPWEYTVVKNHVHLNPQGMLCISNTIQTPTLQMLDLMHMFQQVRNEAVFRLVISFINGDFTTQFKFHVILRI